jgi:hypothetical protein
MASKRADHDVAIDTNPAVIFDPSSSQGANAITIINRADSESVLLVHVERLHDTGEEAGLAPGVGLPFALNGSLGIGKVTVRCESGSATIDFAITRAG